MKFRLFPLSEISHFTFNKTTNYVNILYISIFGNVERRRIYY